MILTSQDMVSGGKYTIEDSDELNIYNIPYTHHFKNASKNYNFFDLMKNLGS